MVEDIIVSNIVVGVIVGLVTTWIAKRSVYETSIRIVRRNIQGLISELRSDTHTFISMEKDREKVIKRLTRLRDEFDLLTGLWREAYRYKKRRAEERGEKFPYESPEKYHESLSQ